MAPLYEMLLTPGRSGRPGLPNRPVAVILHWTANLNLAANAVANRRYFENNPKLKAGAHYVVDDHQIVRCVPELEVAYHAGGTTYTEFARKTFGSALHASTIGIEMCVNSDGDFGATYRHTVELTADIVRRRKIPQEMILRHHDITGKDCPKYWVMDDAAKQFGFDSAATGWSKFKADVMGAMSIADWEQHWAASAIKWAIDRGLMSADKAGFFYPDRPLTRGELATVLQRFATNILKIQ